MSISFILVDIELLLVVVPVFIWFTFMVDFHPVLHSIPYLIKHVFLQIMVLTFMPRHHHPDSLATKPSWSVNRSHQTQGQEIVLSSGTTCMAHMLACSICTSKQGVVHYQNQPGREQAPKAMNGRKEWCFTHLCCPTR